MSVWTEWDPLEEVIVGDCFLYDQLNWDLPKSTSDKFRLVLEESKEDLDNLADYLVRLGVKVYRPTPKIHNQDIPISGFNIHLATAPMVPRDQYMVYGETIYQTYTSLPDRYVDSLSYYHIFQELFDQGHNWISQPPPELCNLPAAWENNGEKYYKDIHQDKILWHTACMYKYGDTLITNTSPGTARGLEWMRRNTPQGKIINTGKFGHIDHGFFNINDDLIICENREWVPKALQNKRLIPVSLILQETTDVSPWTVPYPTGPGRINDEWLDRWLNEWRGYNQEVSFNFNPLVVDSSNVIFSGVDSKLFKLLDSLGVNSHVCPIRHGVFWDSGIHCATLDIKRRGQCRSIIS